MASDMITNLSSDLVDNILSFLPMEEAARTCILSKKWRSMWYCIPQLVFDEAYFHKRSSESLAEIMAPIFGILLVHCGSLRRFDLVIPVYVDIEAGIFDQIIGFLAAKYIQEFTLSPWLNFNNPYRLPSAFYECTKLTYLNLSDCVFELPRDFAGFTQLISIELYYTDSHLSQRDFNTFISKCPLLQRFKVVALESKLGCIEIDAPNLKYLYLNSVGASILLKNVPALSRVIIKGHAECSTDIGELFGSLPSIEHFSAVSGFLTYMCRDGVPERLPIVLNHLKYVELSGIFLPSMKDIPCALLLIRSSPSLEKLKIKARRCIGDEAPILQHLQAPSPTERPFNQLEEVTMENYVGSANQLEFVRFILAEAPVLQKLTIQPPWRTTSDERLKIVAAVTRFRRASSLAEVIFPVSHYG